MGERLRYGLGAGAVFGLLGLMGGFWLGRSTQPGHVEAPSLPAASGGASKPETSILADELPAPKSRIQPPAAELQPTAPTPRAEVSAAAARGSARRSEARSAAKAAPPRPFTLADGLELLGQAERALHSGDAALALAVLGDLDRRAPRAMLRQERLTTLVLAACGTRDTSGAREAHEQLQREFPNSIYARRLERACVEAAPGAPSLDTPSNTVPANLEDSGH